MRVQLLLLLFCRLLRVHVKVQCISHLLAAFAGCKAGRVKRATEALSGSGSANRRLPHPCTCACCAWHTHQPG